jgi:MFS family permease
MIGVGIIAPILPLYIQELGASSVAIGFAFAAFSIPRIIGSPLLGYLSDRIGRRRFIILGLLGFTVVSFLYIIAETIWHLAAVRFVQGMAATMVLPVAQAYIGDITPLGKEGKYINLFSSSMFIGLAIGPLLGGTLGALWSADAAFSAMGGLSFIALLLALLYVPQDQMAGSGDRAPTANHQLMPIKKIITNDAVKAICLHFATRGFWRQGFSAFFPLFAVVAIGISEIGIGIILSVYLFTEGLSQLPFGYLADRYPRLPQIVLGSALAPLMLLVIPFVDQVWSIILIVISMGCWSALARASLLAIRTDIGRTYGMGAVTGLQSGAFSAGQVFGPLGFGLIADLWGINTVFTFGGMVGLAGSIFVLSWLYRWRMAADLSTSVTTTVGKAEPAVKFYGDSGK